ncbi:MAG: c-type cytochrome [Solirubrobacterales bacterium]
MPKSLNSTRLLPALAALVGLALVASGCGTSTSDEERGRALFIQSCGTCHSMAEAGTSEGIGPDLDDAFAAARAVGQTDSTIEGVVKAQVENPRPMTDNDAVSMPANIVEGQDLEDVAAYVGRWAGVPGAAPPKVPGGPGAQVFASSGCGGCHTFAAAEAGGTRGPDLDQVLAGQSMAMIKASIIDPDAVITKGYPPNVMPLIYGESISPAELNDLVAFLAGSTPKAKGGGSK